jgi:hypothetical protein
VRGRRLPGNGRPVTTWVYDADIHAQRIASLGAYTNTFSPANYGLHGPHDASPSGYTGDPGYGVNRWAGKSAFPVQNFIGMVAPIANAKNRRLGIGVGVAGQPGLPNTGGADLSGLLLGYPVTTGWGG